MHGARIDRGSGALLVGIAALLACGAAHAVTGVVKNADGEPVTGARVCHFQYGVEQICVTTDEAGRFEIQDSTVMPIRVVADGYYFETRPAVGDHEIVLRGAPVLLVHLADAVTGEPLEAGELHVIYSAQKKLGPFPANAAGVRIQRVLKPGEVRLIGKSEGYRESDPLTVKLEDGKQTELVIKLEPLPSKDPS